MQRHLFFALAAALIPHGANLSYRNGELFPTSAHGYRPHPAAHGRRRAKRAPYAGNLGRRH
jgi:hypothetical protein